MLSAKRSTTKGIMKRTSTIYTSTCKTEIQWDSSVMNMQIKNNPNQCEDS